MIDEKVINKIIEPIIERQRAISNYTIKLIAQRVRTIGKLDDVNYLTIYNESSEDVRILRKLFDKHAQIQLKAVKQAVEAIIEYIYTETEELYVYRKIKRPNIKKRSDFWLLLTDLDEELEDLLLSLDINKNIGFIIDRNPVSIVDAYYHIIDRAMQAKSINAIDYDIAMNLLLKDLAISEIRYIEYRAENDNYYKPKLDYWIEQNLLYVTGKINEKIQQDTIDRLNCDGVELSAHIDSAPDHEPMQGHQFSLSEFEKLQTVQACKDIHGNEFTAIQRPIRAWNCRHFTVPIIIGVSKPQYTTKQLKAMIDSNAKGYTLPNGKHLTRYQCKQIQNRYKQNIETAKRMLAIAKIADNKALQDEYTAKLSNYIAKYKAFSKACGLPMDKY